MNIFLAVGSFLVSGVLLGFFGLFAYEAISSWGIREAAIEMFYPLHNAIIFIPCFVLGTVFLCAGFCILAGGLQRASRR